MEEVLVPVEITEVTTINILGDKGFNANVLWIDESDGKLKKEKIEITPDFDWDISKKSKGFMYIKGFWLGAKTECGRRKLFAIDDMTNLSDDAKDSIAADIIDGIVYESNRKITNVKRMVDNYLDVKEALETNKLS